MNKQNKIKIGLEVHGYLKTKEKLFCQCATDYKESIPNTNICPICTGMPGSKPLPPNRHALNELLKIALIFKCKINKEFFWHRKHYDWPDMPKGFQSTVSGGSAKPIGVNGEFLGIKISSVHLEEDPARWDPTTGKVDYNRAGMPLVEIVTEPDFKSSTEVREWVKQLILALSYIKAVDSNAGLKADVNISAGSERVEIKNINSIKNIVSAIEFEVKRQTELVNQGKEVERETRAFSEFDSETISMRKKEETQDYRFIPDPDLPTITLNEKEINEIKKNIPEMPQLKVSKFVETGLREREAKILSKERELAEFFESIVELIDKSQKELAAEWVATELLRVLNYNKKKLSEVKIDPKHFSELIELIDDKKITPNNAKKILNDFVPESFSPKSKLGKIKIISDISQIEEICKKVIKQNQKAVEDFAKGEEKSFNFLIGKVMAETKGKANSEIVFKIMKKLLK